MGKSQRTKGATWEREVAKLLRLAGVEAKRGLGQARSASEVADVQVPGWWVECKHHAEARPDAALAQAYEASEWAPELRPVAICKSNRRPPTATWREVLMGVEMTVTVPLSQWILAVALANRGEHLMSDQAGGA